MIEMKTRKDRQLGVIKKIMLKRTCENSPFSFLVSFRKDDDESMELVVLVVLEC